MKKATKIFSVVALCAVMVIMSVVPAFAATIQHVENHSVIDCVGQYKTDDGHFRYIIKLQKGTDLNCVTVFEEAEFISTEIGTISSEVCLGELLYGEEVVLMKSTEEYDIYQYNCPVGTAADRVRIKLYYDYGNKHYMATGAINGSTVEGNGYWLYS